MRRRGHERRVRQVLVMLVLGVGGGGRNVGKTDTRLGIGPELSSRPSVLRRL